MKKLILTLAPIFMMMACSLNLTELPPVRQAIADEIKSLNGNVDYICFTDFALVDSATVSQELCRRKTLFQTKIKTEERFVRKYERKKMLANANKHRGELGKAIKILTEIEMLEDSLVSCKDSVIYRVYKFSCKGRTKNGYPIYGEKYASVSPTLDVLCIRSDDNYFFNMGYTVPGYAELLDKIGGSDANK